MERGVFGACWAHATEKQSAAVVTKVWISTPRIFACLISIFPPNANTLSYGTTIVSPVFRTMFCSVRFPAITSL